MNCFHYIFSLLTFFIYLSNGKSLSQIGRLSSDCPRVIVPHGYYRIRRTNVVKINCYKGYLLFGQRTLSCYLGKWNYDFPKCIRSPGCGKLKSPDKGLIWPYEDGSMVGFLCYPGYILVGSPSLICLNGNWNASVPQCLKPGSLDCNFDSDEDPFCGWIQDATDSWQRVSNPLGGGYLSVETNNTSRIVSPLIKSSPDSKCFFFSRNLEPNTLLKIHLTSNKLSSVSYGSTLKWENSTYSLPPLDENDQLIIEVYGDYGSEHAHLDNFQMIDNESCSSISTFSTNKPSLSTYTQEIGDQSCRFRCTSADALTPEPDYFTSTVQIETTQPNGPIFIRCDCHPGCTEISTCCLDFHHYCIARETLKPQYYNITTTTKKPTSEFGENTLNTTLKTYIKTTTEIIPITKDLNTISLQPATFPSSITVSTPTTFKPTLKTTPTTTKPPTLKTTSTTTKPPTLKTTPPGVRPTNTVRTSIGTTRKTISTKKIITTPTTTTAIPKKNIPTKKVTYIINPVKQTTSRKSTSTSYINPTTNSITKETFIPISLATLKATTKIVETTPSYNAKELTPKDKPLISQTLLILIILGSIGIISISILGIWYVRRRRIYVSRGQLNHLSEDSDVRFLTGDEILDFTLQRPVPEDLDL